MPVESVELVVGHYIYVFLHVLERYEVTAAVEHGTSVRELRPVLDYEPGEFQLPAFGLGRAIDENLGKRLESPPYAFCRTSRDVNTVFRVNGQPILFLSE